jgi:hypothetical protein
MAGIARILLEKMRMVREDALAVAKVVEDAFNGREEMEDEELDTQLRQVFYDLQDAEVLSVRRHEYTGEDGRMLRGYQWHIKEGELIRDEPRAPEPGDEALDVYQSLRPQAWQRRQGVPPTASRHRLGQL